MRQQGYVFSFDMLGEAARTRADAARYFAAYQQALEAVAVDGRATDPSLNNGISVKLSALHPRYEATQADIAVPELVAMLRTLALRARAANVQLTIDAEESERLELSMDVLSGLISDPELSGWHGLGFVVQAYQRRALPVIDWLGEQARRLDAPLFVRLVKGAYWDSEVKRAQELGLEEYPVFTRKAMTDLSYLAAAQNLLSEPGQFVPQFATHNAASVAAIREMAGPDRRIEFQRLFGMGQALHDNLLSRGDCASRIYAPVGSQEDLLSYLIRRLLENGANSSFVHQLSETAIAIEALVSSPLAQLSSVPSIANPSIAAPRDAIGAERRSAKGWDLSDPLQVAEFSVDLALARKEQFSAAPIIDGKDCDGPEYAITNPATEGAVVGYCVDATVEQAGLAMTRAAAAQPDWHALGASARATILQKAADALERHPGPFHYLAIHEAGKSWADAIAEVREAVDFLRYYAARACDADCQDRLPLGVTVCISPWNFPLAIFLGQVAAALAAGNAVIAKPAEQTPLIAAAAVRLLHQAGVDRSALQFLPGDGATLGSTLIGHPATAAVIFTGSTETARIIYRTLVRAGRPLTPLIAETGGINVMIADATALPEQLVDDVMASAFQSAGQRCSALRLLCLQEDIAAAVIERIAGAMADLRVGNPAEITTDIGPVIDNEAQANIRDHIGWLNANARLISPPIAVPADGHFVAPVAYEIARFEDLRREVFGPVLHIVRFAARDKIALAEKINASGYGLTLGIQTRIGTHAEAIASTANVGNIYINRNQIGAVVGVQPFGGDHLSGTGPKAGGPLYMRRLSKPDESRGKANPSRDAPSANALFAALRSIGSDVAGLLPQISAEIEQLQSLAGALPGPTGEANDYRIIPRGNILALGGNILAGLLRALTTGNVVQLALIKGDAHVAQFAQIEELPELGGRLSVQHFENEDRLLQFVADRAFDALLCDSTSLLLPAVADVLAGQSGAIIPILSELCESYRFVSEKCVTRNLAAEGGNVELLNS
ncbi:MAG: bifunctional proline dehydrogenase/L-glutamate gamma-semialdehyde dehydrogenase PutA [Parasphingorhabdus sp.]|nr:bifunctional proline dehydrogenase/L-glutamate gamma-semialdehyde dehydrogenase PutA [Parasphingorhabdus sp.]